MGKDEKSKYSRKNIIPGVIIMVVLAVLSYGLVDILAGYGAENNYLPALGDVLDGLGNGIFKDQFTWAVMDVSQGAFLGLIPSSILLVIFSFLGAYLERNKSKYAGSGMDGNGHIFTRMAIASILGMLLNAIVWSPLFKVGWLPSFTLFLAINAFVIHYGGDFKKLITIVLVCVPICFPFCYLARIHIVKPLGVASNLATDIGLLASIPTIVAIFSLMPWMHKEDKETKKPSKYKPGELLLEDGKSEVFVESWGFIHRVFGDVSELNYWGSSWGAIAMYIGAFISVYLNLAHGSDRLGILIFSQLMTGTLAVFVYYPEWKERGWANTFGSMIFTSGVVLTFPPVWQIIVPTIIIGGIVVPYIIRKGKEFSNITKKLPGLYFTRMGVVPTGFIWSFIVLKLIIPALGL